MRRSLRSAVAVMGAAVLAASAVVGVVGALALPAGASVSDEAGFTDAWISGSITQIDLASNITLTCASGTPQRHSGTPITVDGHGHTLTQSCADKAVLYQGGDGSVTFDAITVTGGQRGGLFSDGPVVVDHSTFTGNHSTTEGGAIGTGVDAATVTLTDSSVTGNSAQGSGGAIASQGLITVTRSTFSGNTSGNNGGALRSYGGATIVDSTFTGNTAHSLGGAVTGGPIELVYATMVGNTGNGGANVEPDGGTLESFGSVIAHPTGGQNCGSIQGATTTHGYNVDDDGSCGFGSGPGDRSDLSADLQLGALAANGGPTQTMLPAKTSPLVDQIPTGRCVAQNLATDQRGLPRISDSAGVNTIDPSCDIGAVEVQGVFATTTTVGSTTTTTAAQPVSATPAFTG